LIRRLLTALLTSILPLLIATSFASAHPDACHSNHSCPPDDNSYVCGDLGVCSQCPDNAFCLNRQPLSTNPAASAAAAAAGALTRAPVVATVAPPPAALPTAIPTVPRPISAVPQPEILLTPEQVVSIQRAGHRLPGGPGPIGSITGPTLSPQQLAAIIAFLPPEEARRILAGLTPAQVRAVAAALPAGAIPILPAALPQTGGGGSWPAVGGAGLITLALGLALWRRPQSAG
jgi:LPXTG-motif cell wall-anchored protein